MASLFPPGVTVDNTLGAAFVGFAVSCAAFGVCTNQAVTYFARYPEDRPAYKLLVVLIWVLTAIDQAFIGHVVYFYTVTNYANPLILLEHVAWTLIVQLTVGSVVATIVRLCFAMRVWRFSQRNVPVTGLVILLTTAGMGEWKPLYVHLPPAASHLISSPLNRHPTCADEPCTYLGLAIAYTVKCFQHPFLTVLPQLKVTASLALGIGAFTDVVIACSLAFFLRRYRTGSKRANTLVTSLTVYAVNTGAVTAAISICTLVFYDVRPTTFQFLAFYFILCKLYAISFFCTLNTRRIIRGKGTERSDGRSDGHTGVSGPGGVRPPGQRTNTNTNTNASGTVNVNVYGPGFGLSQNFKYVPSSAPTTSYGQNLEIGVHQEVSIISDVDVDDFRETKDDMELSPTSASSGYKNPPAVPYAYSPTYEYGGRERVHAYANR
ncbi:hypothetical protein C8F01DRAFT_35925 [Mycena amicta]|nr:hypothetical protein C8F01DRAFT_35925 [Mycena amicta]